MNLVVLPSPAYSMPMISPRQIRSARALVGWTQDRLADAAGLSLAVVNNTERGVTDPKRSTLERIQRALEGAGVQFLSDKQQSITGGEGVRFEQAEER